MRLGAFIGRTAVSNGLLLAAGAAFAHHSVTANFDTGREVEVRGTVVDWRLVSPHSSLVVDGFVYVDGVRQGETAERWEIESSAAPSMRARGFTRDSFESGDQVVVIGAPHRNASLTRMNSSDFRPVDAEPVARTAARTEPSGPIEVTGTGHERIEGRWRPPFQPNGDGSALPLNEAGLEAWRSFDQTGSPANTCEPMSFPVVNNAPGYFMDIRFDGTDSVVIRNQAYDIVRTVPLDGTEAPADPEGQFGIVRGRIDGDRLVVDSRDYPVSAWGLGAATQINGGGADVPSSEQKVLNERFHVSDDAQTLIYEYTLDDPVYMSRPHTARIELARVSDDTPMYAYDCQEDAASMFSRAPGVSLLDGSDD